ncbi:hypothetical protein DFH08DRAFT_827682 [Mycena albidolilacea]|uniref:Uncharacterized protein n=1 Tax=Mycena albidolilacea TaxID=1033008 RepID=A0AAD6YXJ7_9AGAR|nr:hypothetical protein DFH08DRAFT_827682 [Mycena albidolilacea]
MFETWSPPTCTKAGPRQLPTFDSPLALPSTANATSPEILKDEALAQSKDVNEKNGRHPRRYSRLQEPKPWMHPSPRTYRLVDEKHEARTTCFASITKVHGAPPPPLALLLFLTSSPHHSRLASPRACASLLFPTMLKHEKKKWEKQPKIKRITSFLRSYTAGVQAVAGIYAGEGGAFEICVKNESRYMEKEEGQREEGRASSTLGREPATIVQQRSDRVSSGRRGLSPISRRRRRLRKRVCIAHIPRWTVTVIPPDASNAAHSD